MITSTSSALPREELALAIVEGENSLGSLVYPRILGDLPVSYRNAHLVKATLADTLGLRDIAADKYVHAPGTLFERLTAKFGDASVSVTPRGVEIVVPREMTLDYRNRFDVMAFFSTRFGVQISGLTKEKLVADAIFNTTNLGSATNSAVAYTVANEATNSYISDTIAATRRLKAKGEAPMYKQVMSGPVFERIRQSSKVRDYIKGTLGAQAEVTLTALTDVVREFGIDEIIVADSYRNTAGEGATPSLAQIWSNTYIATFKPGMVGGGAQTDGVGVPIISGIGAMVYWEGYANGVPSADRDARTFAGGNYVETYPSIETDSEVIRVKMSHKPAILNSRAGDLISTQYS